MGEINIELTIQSILPSDEPQGRFILSTFSNSTVESVLRDLCRKANVPLKPEYCLRSKGHDLLDRTAILSQIDVCDGAFLHWTSESVETRTPCKFNTFWFLAVISIMIGSVGLAAICVLKSKDTGVITDYAIVFDAGSSHTAMFIYKWEGSKLNGTAIAVQDGPKYSCNGSGISSYADTPNKAGKIIEECLSGAKVAIPKDKHSSTPIYLGATAGMRLLNASNPQAAQNILSSICGVLNISSFKITTCKSSVRIISGEEEGTFSWITSNYVANSFKVHHPDVQDYLALTIVPSIGAMDLGGASTQITFVPKNISEIPSQFLQTVQLFGSTYDVYTHSYLCYGVNEIINSLLATLVKTTSDGAIEHPCLPQGYNYTRSKKEIFSSPCVKGLAGLQTLRITSSDTLDQNYTFIGQSNSTACEQIQRDALFNTSFCPYSRCSFNGIYQPEISGPFYAFSSFFYIANFLNLSTSNTSSFSHANFIKAKNLICNATWIELLEIPLTPQEQSNLMWYCLQSTYINLLLYDGYNFSDTNWAGINFVDKVSSTEVGWSLGFILNESLKYSVDVPDVLIYTVTFALLFVLFCLFIIVSIGLAIQGKKIYNSKDVKYRKMSTYGTI